MERYQNNKDIFDLVYINNKFYYIIDNGNPADFDDFSDYAVYIVSNIGYFKISDLLEYKNELEIPISAECYNYGWSEEEIIDIINSSNRKTIIFPIPKKISEMKTYCNLSYY